LVTSDAARDQEAPGSIRRLVCLFSSSGQAVFVEGLGVWRCIENRPELPLDSAHKKPAAFKAGRKLFLYKGRAAL